MAYQDKNDSRLVSSLLEMAFSLAISLNQTTVTVEHLLYVLTSSETIRKFLFAHGVDMKLFANELYKYIEDNSKYLKNKIENDDPQKYLTGQLTAATIQVVNDIDHTITSEHCSVDICDVLQIILNQKDSYASYFMSKYGITADLIKEFREYITQNYNSVLQNTLKQALGIKDYGPAQAQQSSNGAEHKQTVLEILCENLNEKVKTSTDHLIGREKEIFTIAHTLAKRKKCNALLIGDPGVGKTMIVEGIARKINEGKVPSSLKNKIIYSLDIGSLLAGARFRGDYEEKVTALIADLEKQKNAILFVDEAHQMDAGDGKGQMGLGFSSMIKPALSRGSIKVIASTTWEGFRAAFETDTALMRRFRVVNIVEPSRDETVAILNGSKKDMEKFHKVSIEDTAITASVDMSIKYQPEKKLPDKAIDILDSACARSHISEKYPRNISRDNIIQEITELTGITIKSETTDENDAKKVLNLGNILKETIFHQDKALDQIAKSLIINQAGLRNPNKPIASFLMIGPSGVGKTFTAKQLASQMNMNFIHYNMSEFQERHTVARLIGAPPGYVGFGNNGTGEGQLVNDILQHPNSVLLFDEVEKAHPDIFNVFLQLLDEGELTGTTGKTANAKNCIILMTSNLGSRDVHTSVGFVQDKTGKSESAKAVDNFFLTELRGRMTAIIEFSDLDEISYRKIVLERIQDISRMISTKNVKVVPSEKLVDYILSQNDSTQYGARKIGNLVSDTINYPLSVKLLNGEISNNSIVTLGWKDGKLEIQQEQQEKIPVAVEVEK
ncbi:ATP-dependent Clp protease ATP-binding subunit ClpX [uncultured archaeon]|nr:ATP-dependent Clp protease ATP-binding subunit ClpX [uncultured archaeon]